MPLLFRIGTRTTQKKHSMTRDQRVRKLKREDAVRLASQAVVEYVGDYRHEIYPTNPTTVSKVAVGWVVEFKPIRPQTEDGTPRLALTWVVTQIDHQCHIVGSIGLKRTLKLIETGDSLL